MMTSKGEGSRVGIMVHNQRHVFSEKSHGSLLPRIEADANPHDRLHSAVSYVTLFRRYETRLLMMHVLLVRKTIRSMVNLGQREIHDVDGSTKPLPRLEQHSIVCGDRQLANGFQTALSSKMRNVRPPGRILNVS